MKRIIITIVVSGALIYGSIDKAYGSNKTTPEKNAKITRVSFDEISFGDRIYIKDYDGKTLYSKRIRKEGSYSKMFDLSNLPENQYYFEVDKTEEITILPVSVGKEDVTIQRELRTDIPKPQLTASMDKVLLSRDVKDSQSLKVEIYHKGQDLVYSEEIDKVGKLLRQYDFSKSPSGEYLFYIKYDDRILSEYVNVHTNY